MCLCPSPLVSCMCCTQSGDRPLHDAARKGHEGAIRVLLEGKAHTDAQNKVWPHVGGMQGVGGGRAQAPPTPSHRSLSLSLCADAVLIVCVCWCMVDGVLTAA